MEKSKYTIYGDQKLVYFFVTTTRNTEDCINIMVERYQYKYENLKIFRTTNREKTLVYHYLKTRTHKKVLCIKTGDVYPDVKTYALRNRVHPNSARRWLTNYKYPLIKPIRYAEA